MVKQKHNSPYLYVRLKRKGQTKKNIWVLLKYHSHEKDRIVSRFRKIRFCKTEEEAIDCLVDIAEKWREQFQN